MTMTKGLVAIAALALSVAATPAFAHDDDGYSYYNRHAQDHAEHWRYHQEANEAHRRAHEEGFESSAEHRAYHRALPAIGRRVRMRTAAAAARVLRRAALVLAVELRSQALKSAAIFTFGNSYLSMVLLISLLMSYGMNLRWGDPLGALVMFPFMAQKGIQILLEEGKHEYVED